MSKGRSWLGVVRQDFEEELANGLQIRHGNHPPEDHYLDWAHRGGIFLGRSISYASDEFIGKPFYKDGNLFVVGGPGSGKTDGIVKFTLGSWTGRQIVLDVKGGSQGLVHTWHQVNSMTGKKLKVFNPMLPDTVRFAPLSFMHRDSKENLGQNARDLALALIPTPMSDSDNQKFWAEMAQNLLTGAILHYYSKGLSFVKMMIQIQMLSVDDLMQEILGDEFDEEAAEDEDQPLKVDNGEIETLAKMYVSKLIGLKPEILAGVAMDFGRFVTLATDPMVKNALSIDDNCDFIDWCDFIRDDRKYDVILQIPEYKLDQWEPLISLMLNQLMRALEYRVDKYTPSKRSPAPLLLMLDEFARLGTCQNIRNGLATLRSRDVTIALFVQSLAQLDARYGVAGRKEILDCCSYKALLSVSEPDDQEYFSRLVGTTMKPQVTVSETNQGRCYGYQEARQRVVEPEELGRITDSYYLLAPWGFSRILRASYHKVQHREYLITKYKP